MTEKEIKSKISKTIRHPIMRPTFLCRPDLVKGIPVFLDILFFKPEIPTARFHEKEIPNYLPIKSFILFHQL
jgi:hypothetical protein